MAPDAQRRPSTRSRRREPVGRRAAFRVLVAGEHGQRLAIPGLARWLTAIAPARAQGTVSIAVVGDARIRALNRRYRGRDCATDVLSFPAAPSSPPKRTRRTQRASQVLTSASSVVESSLGDIVIGRGVARRQAREAGHSELTELRVLALHGLLHLLGYDHERDNGRMRRVEGSLRRKGGLHEGLIERGSPSAQRAAASASGWGAARK